MVFDYGLRLGALLETADTLTSMGENDFGDVATLLDELAEISKSIEDLHRHPSSPREASSRGTSDSSHDSRQATPPMIHPGLAPKIVALGVQLIACATGYAVALKATGLSTVVPGSTAIESTNPNPSDLATTKEWFDSKRISLALEIYKFSASYINHGNGMVGQSRIIFPLRLAFEQLDPSSDQHPKCRALLQKLEGKGMKFEPTLNRNESVASSIIRHKRPFTALKSTAG